jgi:hypothetical protein
MRDNIQMTKDAHVLVAGARRLMLCTVALAGLTRGSAGVEAAGAELASVCLELRWRRDGPS